MQLIYSVLFLTNIIILDNNNIIPLYGKITKSLANNISYQINSNNGNKYLYINSYGGDVESGNYIINQIQSYNIPCITHQAYSMAAVIFLGCKERYITHDSKIMFHNVTTNNQLIAYNYYKFLSDNLNMSYSLLYKYLQKDWYLYGKNIQKYIDINTVKIKCTPSLTNNTMTVNSQIYSKCPNIRYPINKKDRCKWMGC